MYKYLLFFLVLLSSCIIIPAETYYGSSDRVESGAIVQGSKLWMRRSLPDQAVRIVDGPIIINYFRVSSGCKDNVLVGTRNSFGTDWHWNFTPGMEANNLELFLQRSESLVLKPSDNSYDGDCYVTWRGYLPW